jgi:hypothetical protein
VALLDEQVGSHEHGQTAEEHGVLRPINLGEPSRQPPGHRGPREACQEAEADVIPPEKKGYAPNSRLGSAGWCSKHWLARNRRIEHLRHGSSLANDPGLMIPSTGKMISNNEYMIIVVDQALSKYLQQHID